MLQYSPCGNRRMLGGCFGRSGTYSVTADLGTSVEFRVAIRLWADFRVLRIKV